MAYIDIKPDLNLALHEYEKSILGRKITNLTEFFLTSSFPSYIIWDLNLAWVLSSIKYEKHISP